MFPIVHYFTNKTFNQKGGAFLILGGIFPDLASSAGIKRDDAHQVGESFYYYCLENAREGLPLARGILGHGIKPYGMDYYADEYWPGGERGWCFQQGKSWARKVGQSTLLPEELWYWKSHNFIEMALDLLVDREHPELKNEILRGISDESQIREAAGLLATFFDLDHIIIADALKRATAVFSIENLSPLDMAKKQAEAFKRRHMVYNSDVFAMAELLEEIAQSLDYRSTLR